MEIKNLKYYDIDNSVFNVEVRAKMMNYGEDEKNEDDLNKLQETVLMDELYSISASRFLGKS